MLLKNKNKTNFCFSILIAVYTIIAAIKIAYANFCLVSDSNSYTITDFLINYEGGFVRRGLMGEIIQFVCSHIAISPKALIVIISLISFAIVFYLLIKLFIRKKYNLWIIFCPIILTALYENLIRKDYLLFLSIFAIFYCYKNIKSDYLKLSIITLVILLALNLHEAFIFFGVPFLSILILRDKNLKLSKAGRYTFAALPYVFFLILSYFKGNQAIAQAITDSWIPYMPDDFSTKQTTSIGAIGWNMQNTFCNHFRLNFLTQSHGIYAFIIRPIIFFFTFYLALNILFVMSGKRVDSTDRVNLLNLLLFHFITLIPMFTILSCDQGRNVQYWILASYIIFLILDKEKINSAFPKWVTHKSIILDHWIMRILPANKLVIFLLILILNITPSSFDIDFALEHNMLLTITRGISMFFEPFIG